MKILHIITAINRGGAENHLRDLIEGQTNGLGYKVACAYLKGDGYWKENIESLGVNVYPLGLSSYGEIRPLLALVGIIGKFRPDIVHAHLAPAELYTRLALIRYPNLPFVISRHNESRFYRGPGADLIERWVVKRANRIIAISNSVKKFYSERWPEFPGSRIDVVHYGIDPSPFQKADPANVSALREEWGGDASTILIGCVARLVPAKALDILLEGFAKFLSIKNTPRTKLVIVGSGPLEERLKNLGCQLGINDRIIWAGFRQDIPTVINALDIFALTSITEGFGLVLIEAMASGKPVIATRVSAIPEIVIPDKTGILITPNNPTAVSESLVTLTGSLDLRRTYGKNGRELVVKKFGIERMCLETAELYKKIVSRPAI